MQFDEWAIGERIAAHRTRRGLTQAELAGLMGVSLSLLKKIERGDRPVTKFSQLVQFAEALRIRDLRDLTGMPMPLLPDGTRDHPAAEAVRTAMLQRPRSAGESLPLSQLASRIERTWQVWQSPSPWRYARVGQELPAIMRSVRAALTVLDGAERRDVLREASKAYQLVRTWAKRVGEHELSLLAADRAALTALEADDPDLAGAASWNLALILSAKGKTGEAQAVIHEAIEDMRPWLGDAPVHRLAVWGGLHLLGAVEAARDDQGGEVWRLLKTADHVASRTGETNHFRMVLDLPTWQCMQSRRLSSLDRRAWRFN